MDPAALLDGLDPDQAEAVSTPASPLCILAGAGSGKTRVLTRRVAHRIATGGADPRHVLVLTFTRKAAAELVDRLAAFGFRDRVTAGTFHAVAYAQLRQRWAEDGRAAPTLVERKARLLAPLVSGTGTMPAEVAAEIEWASARLVAPEGYVAAAARAGRRPPLAAEAVAEVFARYRDVKRRKHLVDFDDLLAACATAIEHDPAFAERQRWRFRHLFVDEFQDVNPLQHRLLEGWRGGRDDLCVVGDPDQAIYGWNGADAGYLTGFAGHHPGARVVRLARSYRSSPEILVCAQAVQGGRAAGATPLVPARPPGPVPTVRAYASDADEAAAIAQALRDARGPGRRWADLAVLTRTRAQAAVLEEALRAARVPYRVRGAGPLLDRQEIRAALARLTDGTDPAPLATRLADLELGLAASGAVGSEGDPAGERRGALEALVRLGHEYLDVDPAASSAGFGPWLAATVRSETVSVGADAVELATFHAAKGLEWSVVFLAGLEEGFVPVSHATTNDALREERNLLYVAATRAEHELHCSWARTRTFGTRTVERSPSPLLALLDAAAQRLAGTTRPAAGRGHGWRSGLASARDRLAEAGPSPRPVAGGFAGDDSVLTALRRWRAAEARAADVAPQIVLPDEALAVLVAARPATVDDVRDLPGIGPLRAARYGERLVALVADARGGAS
ncbi:MAG: UvrD-helicase domain-containing protein [Acidimicrobiales bacterium]|nr:UvrD-helicase domain-containing protein [Acidimicrobiales bacterium]